MNLCSFLWLLSFEQAKESDKPQQEVTTRKRKNSRLKPPTNLPQTTGKLTTAANPPDKP